MAEKVNYCMDKKSHEALRKLNTCPKCKEWYHNCKCQKPEEVKMDLVMYIFINKGLKMSPGKIAAQASHAAVKSYLISSPTLRAEWDKGIYKKIILMAESTDEMVAIRKDIGKDTFKVIDLGLTELKPNQFTALGVEIVDKERDGKTFKSYNLFR